MTLFRFVPLVLLLAVSTGCEDAASPTDPSDPGSTSETVFSVVAPDEMTLSVGDSAQIKAVATLRDGTYQIVTTSASWQSSDTGVASVSASGIVTGVGIGNADVTVTFDGIQATSTLTVSSTPPNATRFLGTVAGLESQSGTFMVTFGATPRVTGVLFVAAGVIDLLGRLDSPTHIINVAGGGYTLLGRVDDNVLAGTYTAPNGSVGGFVAIDATHSAVTGFCGSYTTDAVTPAGNVDSGSFVLAVSLEGTVVGVFVPSDGSVAPTSLAGRRDENSIALTGNSSTTVSGELQADSITGSFQTRSKNTGTFTATSRSCR